MKKRILCLALLLCVAVFAFSGCIRMRTTLNFSPFGFIETDVVICVDKAIASYATQLDEEIEKYKAKGYVAEEFEEDGYIGYRLHKTESIFDPPVDERFKSSVDGLKVSLDILWDSTKEESQEWKLTLLAPVITAQNGSAEIIITLPNKPIAHNATSVSEDGKTLTWNLLEMGDRSSAHVEFSALDVVMGWIIIGVCALVVIIAVIVIIIVVAAKKKKAKAASALTDTSEKTEKAAEETAAAVEKTSEAGE